MTTPSTTLALPPIPDEAVRAVVPCDHCWRNRERHPWRRDYAEVRENLAAAWPHLYAAALRHAADEVEALGDLPGTSRDIYQAYVMAANLTRVMADEATP